MVGGEGRVLRGGADLEREGAGLGWEWEGEG